MSLKDDFEVLGIQPGSSPKLIYDTYRNLVASAESPYRHPDKGGDPLKFNRLGVAYHNALDFARAENCDLCAGTGSINHRKGFTATEITCTQCRGTRKRHVFSIK